MAKMADDMIKRCQGLGMDCPDMGDGKRPVIQGIKPEPRGVGDELEGWPGGSDSKDEVEKKERTQRTADRSQW